jgi:hypothetical protein
VQPAEVEEREERLPIKVKRKRYNKSRKLLKIVSSLNPHAAGAKSLRQMTQAYNKGPSHEEVISTLENIDPIDIKRRVANYNKNARQDFHFEITSGSVQPLNINFFDNKLEAQESSRLNTAEDQGTAFSFRGEA